MRRDNGGISIGGLSVDNNFKQSRHESYANQPMDEEQ